MGNEASIKVWRDNWVLEVTALKPLVPKFLHDATVSFLIDVSIQCWNVQLLHDCFLPFEVDAIASIPLSYMLSEDIRFWPYAKDGKFSVKASYHVVKGG